MISLVGGIDDARSVGPAATDRPGITCGEECADLAMWFMLKVVLPVDS